MVSRSWLSVMRQFSIKNPWGLLSVLEMFLNVPEVIRLRMVMLDFRTIFCFP